jgi:integrase
MNCIKCNASIPDGAAFCPACGKKQAVTQKKRSGSSRPNGSGSVYKRGKTWMCAVILGYVIQEDGTRKAKKVTKGGFRTKKEALDYLPILQSTPVRKIPSLMDLWCTYTASKKYQKLSDSRKEKYEIAWKKLESLWFWKIDDLTTFDLQNAVDSNADTYYTARDLKNLLSKLYQTALPDEFVKSNLSEYIELPDLNAKEQQPFQKEEITKLWNDYAAGNWWTGYILLMIYTGMMPGELLDARKSHIDWDGKQIVGAGKKTAKRRETPIVLADFILPVLSDLCDHTDGDKLIRINKDRFYEVYYSSLERAGCRKLTPYSCRHTAATTLALENIPPSVIQQIMRHSRYTTTEKYIHISIDPMLEAVNKLAKKASENG